MSAIDSARRLAIAKGLNSLNMAFAMDQAALAIHNGGANAEEVALIVGTYIKACKQASSDMASGLHAIMPNDVAELTSTKDLENNG